jgi:single-strand DNA-binding protein
MSVNKVILVGNVGKRPEVHYIKKGMAVARFSLATSEKGFTTQEGKEIPERTEWHNIVVWKRLAEVVEEYVVKGALLYIEGKLRTNSYEDKNGVRNYRTEIHADVLKILGNPRKKNDELNREGSEENKQQTNAKAGSVSHDEVKSGLSAFNEETNEIPF